MVRRRKQNFSLFPFPAGGLLSMAYPGGTRFIRKFANAGRVDVDLANVMARPGSGGDIILQPGGSLTIPEYIPTVGVQGGVTTPVSVLYREGAGLDYYIDNAGGYARLADKGRVSVRFANDSARSKHRTLIFFSSKPTPGSVVVVPDKPESKTDGGGTIASIAQIISMAATVLIVALRL